MKFEWGLHFPAVAHVDRARETTSGHLFMMLMILSQALFLPRKSLWLSIAEALYQLRWSS
jgi:hypothetical protein